MSLLRHLHPFRRARSLESLVVGASMAIALGAATRDACAGYGNISVTNVTSSTMTVNWTHPTGNLAYASSPHVEICWKKKPYLVGPCIGGDSTIVWGGSSSTIIGLQPDTTYEVRVSGWTQKWAWGACCPFGWAWRSHQWREVAQTTVKTGSTAASKLVANGAEKYALNVIAQIGNPADWAAIRIGYKRFGSTTFLDNICTQINGPSTAWTSSSDKHGWIDSSIVNTGVPFKITGLTCKDTYFIHLYGLAPGASSYTKLATLSMKTTGKLFEFCGGGWFMVAAPSEGQVVNAMVAAEHDALLAEYAALIEASYGGSVQGVIDALDSQFQGLGKTIVEANEYVEDESETDFSTSTFHLLRWLMIDFEGGQVLEEWQATDPLLASRGLLFATFIANAAPELAAEAADLVSTFQMGDVNHDEVIDGADITQVLGAWNTSDVLSDVNADGVVDGGDLSIVLGNWSPAPTAP